MKCKDCKYCVDRFTEWQLGTCGIQNKTVKTKKEIDDREQK